MIPTYRSKPARRTAGSHDAAYRGASQGAPLCLAPRGRLALPGLLETGLPLPPQKSVARQGEPADYFWVLLSGEVEAVETIAEDDKAVMYAYQAGARIWRSRPTCQPAEARSPCETTSPSQLLRFDQTAFWRLMTDCPEVRQAILRNMAMRLQKNAASCGAAGEDGGPRHPWRQASCTS